jgi:hypoxanthine phosphoribosyltransferase
MAGAPPSVRLERRYESRLIADRVEAVAGAIDRDFKDRPLAVVSILKGAAVFMADLTRKMKGPFACEYLHVRRAAADGDIMQIDFTTGFSVKGRHVLLLKDVVHTGITENYLMEHLTDGGAASLRLAAIIDRPLDRKANVPVDFSLFSSESEELYAGYGMEHDGLHAHLPDIYEVLAEQ